MTALISIVNTFGTNVIAAYSVVMRIGSLATLPAMNFGAALSTFVGQNIGAKKMERVKSGFVSTLKMSSIVSISISAFILLGSGFLMNLFTDDPEVIRYGKEYLLVVGGFYVVFSAMFTISGVMRGAGDTLIPMFFSLISLWLIRIPSAWFLSKHFGEVGIWWSMPLGWTIGLILAYSYYLTGNWKKKAIV